MLCIKNLVQNNFNKARLILLLPAIIILFFIILGLLSQGSLSVDNYVEIQKDLFFYMNSTLSEMPNIQINLTQLGNPLILFSLLTIFIIYTPRFWTAILISTIISAILSVILKELFDVPRPSVKFNHDSFVIIGEIHSGYASLPSGHSMTFFTAITLLLFAFMPKKFNSKIAWIIFIIMLGVFVAISRIGVGAHFPLDVVIGASIGYIAAIFAIVITNKIKCGAWIDHKKYHIIIMVLLTLWGCAIVNEILTANLFVFYFALISIITTLYLMLKSHVKK